MIKFLHWPMPPSVNKAYMPRTWGNKRGLAKTKEHENYIRAVNHYALANIHNISDAQRLIKQWNFVRVEIWLYFFKNRILTLQGLPKVHDGINVVKVLDDQVARVLKVDDKIFWDHRIIKSITSNDKESCSIFLSQLNLEDGV